MILEDKEVRLNAFGSAVIIKKVWQMDGKYRSHKENIAHRELHFKIP